MDAQDGATRQEAKRRLMDLVRGQGKMEDDIRCGDS